MNERPVASVTRTPSPSTINGNLVAVPVGGHVGEVEDHVLARQALQPAVLRRDLAGVGEVLKRGLGSPKVACLGHLEKLLLEPSLRRPSPFSARPPAAHPHRVGGSGCPEHDTARGLGSARSGALDGLNQANRRRSTPCRARAGYARRSSNAKGLRA